MGPGRWAGVPFWPIFPLSAGAVPRGLRHRPPAWPSREPTWAGPAHRPPAPSPWHLSAPPPALGRPARGPARPSPRPARLPGRGWGGGGRRRRREEIGGATPAAHWLPRPGARSPACLTGSRDPFQRWPPCCFDE